MPWAVSGEHWEMPLALSDTKQKESKIHAVACFVGTHGVSLKEVGSGPTPVGLLACLS